MKTGTRIVTICDLPIGHEGTIPEGARGTYRGISSDEEHRLFEMDEDHGFLSKHYDVPNCFLGPTDSDLSDSDLDIRDLILPEGCKCHNCGGKGEAVGEVDAPVSCDDCGQPIDYSLTPEGVEYVIKNLRTALTFGLNEHIIPETQDSMSFFHGSRRYEIGMYWALNVQGNYELSEADKKTVVDYLDACHELDEKREG